jgi:hypothetical protein
VIAWRHDGEGRVDNVVPRHGDSMEAVGAVPGHGGDGEAAWSRWR